MPQNSTVILLEKARETRAQAERARRLAVAAGADDIAEKLRSRANELEQQALELESKAASIQENAERIHELTDENHKLIAEIKERIRKLHGARKPDQG